MNPGRMQGEFYICRGTAAGNRCDNQHNAGIAIRVVSAKTWAQAVAIGGNNGARNVFGVRIANDQHLRAGRVLAAA